MTKKFWWRWAIIPVVIALIHYGPDWFQKSIKNGASLMTLFHKDNMIAQDSTNTVMSQNQTGDINMGNVTKNYNPTTYNIYGQLQSLEEALHVTLEDKYSLGYKLFAISDKKIIRHNEDSSMNGFFVDWDSARIENVNNDKIWFIWPNMYDAEHHNQFKQIGSRIRRIEGETVLSDESTFLPFNAYVEVIKNESDVVYLVVGFRDKNKPLSAFSEDEEGKYF